MIQSKTLLQFRVIIVYSNQSKENYIYIYIRIFQFNEIVHNIGEIKQQNDNRAKITLTPLGYYIVLGLEISLRQTFRSI